MPPALRVRFALSLPWPSFQCRVDDKTSRVINGQCLACARLKRSERNKVSSRRWTQEDIRFLLRQVGKQTSVRIGAALGRTGSAVNAQAHQMGLSTRLNSDASLTTGEIERILQTRRNEIWHWFQRGLPHVRQGRNRMTRGRSLVRWLTQERPEAYDWLERLDFETFHCLLPSQVTENMARELYDALPEPPAFKIIECKGWHEGDRATYPGPTTRTVSHGAVRYALTDLYNNYPFCPLCGKRLPRWATAYANEWPGPTLLTLSPELLAPGFPGHT